KTAKIFPDLSVFFFISDKLFKATPPLFQKDLYKFGDVIEKQDDPADSFYVLTRGRARALKIKPDGEEIPLGVLKPGDSFGEAALAEGGTRNATVRCSPPPDPSRTPPPHPLPPPPPPPPSQH